MDLNFEISNELGLLARTIIRDYPELYQIFAEREYTWNTPGTRSASRTAIRC